MKKYTIQQVKDLQPEFRVAISKLLNDFALGQFSGGENHVVPMVIDGNVFEAEYSPISFCEHHLKEIPEGAPIPAASIDIVMATGNFFNITMEATDFGKPVPEEDIDAITAAFVKDAIAWGVHLWISKEHQEAIDGDFDKHMTIGLTERAGGLIDVDYTNSYSYVQYVGTDGKVRFKNEFDDAVGMISQWDGDHYQEMTKRQYLNCFHHAIVDEQIYPGTLIIIAFVQ